MTSIGFGKIWILVPDWSRFKSSEPNVGHVKTQVHNILINIGEMLLLKRVNPIVCIVICGNLARTEAFCLLSSIVEYKRARADWTHKLKSLAKRDREQ